MKTRQAAEHATTSCHVFISSGLHLPAEVGSGATMCPMALDPHLLIEQGSGAAMYPTAPNPATPQGRALALPHILWLQTPPPYRGGLWHCHVSRGSKPCHPTNRLWCCHVSHGSGPRLPVGEGSGAATCQVGLSGPQE
jgi:hypothetical protein